jgi:hypothetical protein
MLLKTKSKDRLSPSLHETDGTLPYRRAALGFPCSERGLNQCPELSLP